MAGLSIEQLKESLHGKVPARTPIAPNMDGSWSQLAELILDAEIKDEVAAGVMEQRILQDRQRKIEFGQEVPDEIVLPKSDSHMRALAMRVAISIDMLEAIREDIDSDLWSQKKLERVIRMEIIRNRANNWEEIEAIALEKLKLRIEHTSIDESALLQIASQANRMNQVANLRSEPASGGNVMVQINNVNRDMPNGDLPGPGSLGTITLSLSKRVANQLALPKKEDVEGDRFLDSIEMLGARDVPSLLTTDADGNQIIEGESNVDESID